MKYLILVPLLLLAACDHEEHQAPAPQAEAPPPLTKTIAGKISQVESETQLNGWRLVTDGEIRTHQVVVTHYYVIFTDGTKMQVPMEEFAVVNVGDKKQVPR